MLAAGVRSRCVASDAALAAY